VLCVEGAGNFAQSSNHDSRIEAPYFSEQLLVKPSIRQRLPWRSQGEDGCTSKA